MQVGHAVEAGRLLHSLKTALATFPIAGVFRRDFQEHTMAAQTYWDTFKAESDNVLAKIKALVHEGNVRRVVVKHGGRTVAEFPLTAGVIGAVLAPVLAAISALVALLKECTIEVERERQEADRDQLAQPVARS
jgi:hypothetical protein